MRFATLGDLVSIAWNQVVREPFVREANNASHSPALVADLSFCGFWIPQSKVLFDVRIVDTDPRTGPTVIVQQWMFSLLLKVRKRRKILTCLF